MVSDVSRETSLIKFFDTGYKTVYYRCHLDNCLRVDIQRLAKLFARCRAFPEKKCAYGNRKADIGNERRNGVDVQSKTP